ncbi:MAG: hypothetical protein ACD_37C00442G0004 [uncultured bacterium]|nr:MAG: hypothetical protein ACD_37C00442G0004 [uncultured bacterium]
MNTWFSQNYEWITALLAFLAVIVPIIIYRISIRKTEKELLEHREEIQGKLRIFELNIQNKRYASEVRIIDTKRYPKEYPSGINTKEFVDLKAEFKECCFDGVEFFMDMPVEAKQREGGSVEIARGITDYDFIVLPVGKVPYEWIDFIDLGGDEYHNFPLVHCQFKGKSKNEYQEKTPYKEILYYQKQDSGYYKEVKI